MNQPNSSDQKNSLYSSCSMTRSESRFGRTQRDSGSHSERMGQSIRHTPNGAARPIWPACACSPALDSRLGLRQPRPVGRNPVRPPAAGLRTTPRWTNGPMARYDPDRSSLGWRPRPPRFGLLESNLQAEGHQSTCAVNKATRGRFQDPNRTQTDVLQHTPGQQADVPCLALDMHDRGSIAKPSLEWFPADSQRRPTV